MIDDVMLRSTMFERLATRTLKGSIVPALLGISASTILRDRLSDSATLVSSGLLSVESDGDVTIVDRLRRLATVPGSAGLDVHRLLLDAAPASELEWTDFGHIAEGIGVMVVEFIDILLRRGSARGLESLICGFYQSIRNQGISGVQIKPERHIVEYMPDMNIYIVLILPREQSFTVFLFQYDGWQNCILRQAELTAQSSHGP